MKVTDNKTGIEYKVINEISRGGFGIVFKVTDKINCYALKKLYVTDKNESKIMNEFGIHSSLEHKNIINIINVFGKEGYIFMIMELAKYSLYDLLLSMNKSFSEKKALRILNSISEGLQYLHSKFIVHRDIKLENILIDVNDNIKICDFGLSKQLKDKDEVLYKYKGTLNYLSPEIVCGKSYSFCADIWASGVLFYEMLHLVAPFYNDNDKIVKENIINGKYYVFKYLSFDIVEILANLLNLNRLDRQLYFSTEI